MKLTYDEVIEYLKGNTKELLKMKSFYKQSENMTDEDFIKWYFVIYSHKIKQGYIEIEAKTKEKTININGKSFVRYSLYKDTESNLKLCSLHIGAGITRHFEDENDMLNYFETLNLISDKTLELFSVKDTYKCHKELFKQTDDDWYGTYKLDLNNLEDEYNKNLRNKLSKIKGFNENKGYCTMSLTKISSNLDLWCIIIGGNDDYSLSKDFLSKDEAKNEWDRLMNLEIINKKDLENYYFSN